MIAQQNNSWIVVLRKTPDRDAVVQKFLSRKAAIMFIGNSNLNESDRRTERKQREWRAAHRDRINQQQRALRKKNREAKA